MDDISRKMA